ncbi:hypothetical protein [Sphingomonas asaccharolytica]|uniref:hypothetical protein n=1 Tax=Sphingomonas asaccharolytica TaxID=40681 RepID=UPI002480FBA3|nr:hypothetical protein [Sphingomonas asaccharolytica]
MKLSPSPIRTGRDIYAADPRRWRCSGERATPRTGCDRFRQRAARAADADRFGQLDAVERIDRTERIRVEHVSQDAESIIGLTRPETLEPDDLRLDAFQVDPSLRRQRRHAGDARRQVAKIARPARVGRGREREVALTGFLVEAGAFAFALGEAIEFIVQIGRDILAPVGKAGEGEGPQVQSRVEIVAKSPRGNGLAQIAVGARDQLKFG